MKKLLVILIIGSMFFACSNNSENNNEKKDTTVKKTDTSIVENKNEEVVKSEFLLDELLKYNSEKELIEKFGKENVKRRIETFAEGTVEAKLSVLYPKTDKEVRFMWSDDSLHMKNLTTILVSQPKSPWISKEGIKIGTRMSELVKLNGNEFMFGGFDWDYGGYTNFKDGNLANINLIITLGWNDDKNQDETVTQKLLGDIEIKTDSEPAKKYNPMVVELHLENNKK